MHIVRYSHTFRKSLNFKDSSCLRVRFPSVTVIFPLQLNHSRRLRDLNCLTAKKLPALDGSSASDLTKWNLVFERESRPYGSQMVGTDPIWSAPLTNSPRALPLPGDGFQMGNLTYHRFCLSVMLDPTSLRPTLASISTTNRMSDSALPNRRIMSGQCLTDHNSVFYSRHDKLIYDAEELPVH